MHLEVRPSLSQAGSRLRLLEPCLHCDQCFRGELLSVNTLFKQTLSPVPSNPGKQRSKAGTIKVKGQTQ